MNKGRATRALATGSLVLVVVIVIAIVLLAGYGTYRYVPQVHTVVHNVIHPPTTSAETLPTTSTIQIVPSTTISITQPVIVATVSGTTEFFPTTSTSASTAATISSNSQSTGSQSSQTTTVTQSVSSNQSYPFILNSTPTVFFASNGQPYLNASYTNTLNSTLNVYESVSLETSSGSNHVGGPLFTVTAGGTMLLTLQLGVNLPSGSYLVTFYVVNNASGQQLSVSESIHFTVSS